MDDCIFCKIVKGEIPSKKVFADELVYAFEDISPKAPVHILVIPRQHISSVSKIVDVPDEKIAGHMLYVASEIAREKGLSDSGYRLIINHGRDAGQAVAHLHLHIMGGRPMGWPPG